MTGGAADPAPRAPGAQVAAQAGQGNVLVQLQGDGNEVTVDRAHLTLTRYRMRRDQGGDALLLLQPYACAVPLAGRDGALAELQAWLDDARPIAARLLVAPAGIGKTRLALELCDRAADTGWDAGFLTHRELARFATAHNAGTWGWAAPTLIVVDHAAAMLPLLRDWLVELAARLPDAPPLRLLLLERHADARSGWWRELAGAGDAESDAVLSLFDPAAPVPLPALPSVADRRAIFAAMMARLGAAHLLPAPDPAFDRHFGDVEWGGEPLALLLAATAAADVGVGTALALGRSAAALKVGDAEVARLRRFARDEAAAPFLPHLAAVATLCGGLARGEALDVVAAERSALRRDGAGDVRALYDDLRRALPDPASPGGVAPVLPDAVGEAVVLRALGEGDAEEAVEAVRRAAARAWDRVAAVVARAAHGYGEVPGAVGAPLAWLDALAEDAGDDPRRLAPLVAALPWHTAHLRERAAAISARLVRALRADPATPPATLARRLNDLSARLASVGRPDEALAAVEEAAAIWRREAAAGGAARADLAIALTNLAARLGEAGRHADAARVGSEAVPLLRALPPTVDARERLAAALNNLGAHLAAAGHADLAPRASAEAVAVARTAAAERPASALPTLASALHTLSNLVAASGRPAPALELVDEAIAHRRALAAVHPTAFAPELATSLNARSNRLHELGRADEALAAVEEAVRTIAPHAAAAPAAFERVARTIAENYRRQCAALARDADAALLEPVERALARLRRG